jgi:hypothetical protein
MALIQLLDGSIPIASVAAVVVLLSEIKYPPADAIETETVAMFLMVISRPILAEAAGSFIV